MEKAEKKDSKPMIEKKECVDLQDRALAMSEISLLLHSYDDIFSDFDPRSYSQRALSEDFLSELKRASIDKSSGPLQLRFMIAKDKHDTEKEAVIKKRLRSHFRRHYEMLLKQKAKIKNDGVLYTLIGAMMILLATFIYPDQTSGFLSRMLFVILEPTGWFVSWYGLERIFRMPEQLVNDSEFYSKMATAEIIFIGY